MMCERVKKKRKKLEVTRETRGSKLVREGQSKKKKKREEWVVKEKHKVVQLKRNVCVRGQKKKKNERKER